MDPEPAVEQSLAPNQRERNLRFQNQYIFFKKGLIVFIIVSILFTAIFITYLLIKKQNTSKGLTNVPKKLSTLPVFPQANIVSAKETENEALAEWNINSTDIDSVAAWYAGTISEDDDNFDFEITSIPDNYDSNEFSFVIRENEKIITIQFKKQRNSITVKALGLLPQ